MQNLVGLMEKTGARKATTLVRVRRAVWAMLHAADAGVVSKSADGLARMMTIVVEVFGEFGLKKWEHKMETLLMRIKEKSSPPQPPPHSIEAAGQKNAQTIEF